MKRDVLLTIFLSLMVYNAIPLTNLLFPASILYTFLTDLWIVNAVFPWFARCSSAENMASNFGFPL